MTPTITLPRATVEQALEAMRRAVPTGKITLYEWAKALSDLDAALAQQAESVQESSAYSKDWCLRMAQIEMDAGAEFEIGPDRAQQAEPVEPVAYIHRQGNYWDTSERHLTDDEKARGWTEEPLYTAPPQRKPLTDEEIDALPWNGSPRQFARAVERALEEKNRGR